MRVTLPSPCFARRHLSSTVRPIYQTGIYYKILTSELVVSEISLYKNESRDFITTLTRTFSLGIGNYEISKLRFQQAIPASHNNVSIP